MLILSKELIAFKFAELVGSDYDYLVIGYNDSSSLHLAWDTIPYHAFEEFNIYIPWEDVEGAIEWHFRQGVDVVEVYDLYAPFKDSLIRKASKDNYNIVNKLITNNKDIEFLIKTFI